MRIIRTRNKRGDFYTVDGIASFDAIDVAVDIAFDSLREIVKSAPVHTLWTVYS